MAVKFRDYYDILGVPKDATDDKIRKVFRKLARKYHPDVNPGDKAAEEKFKEINEAYAVLSAPDKRKKYDPLGSWEAGADFTPPPQSGNGNGDYSEFSDMYGGGSGIHGGEGRLSEFFESLFGGRSHGSPRREQFKMRGEDVWAEIELTLEEAHRGVTKTIRFEESDPCPDCMGSGVTNGRTCSNCRGEGTIRRLRTFDVNIPAGARDESAMRLPGKGEPGINGASSGDLLLHVRIHQHALFELTANDDIQVELPISPWEAVLGAKLPVMTLDGTVEMTIPPGTQSGQTLRLRQKGLNRRDGGRGNQYVKIRIVVPPKPTENEKSLFEQLAAESKFKPRELMPRNK